MGAPARHYLAILVRFFFRAYFRLVHRVKIAGLDNLPRSGGKILIVANHGSLLDGPLLWAFLPLTFTTLIAKDIAERPLLRSVLTGDEVIKVSTLQSYSLKHALSAIEKGRPLLIFPEGRRSTTGGLMKVYEGAGFLAYRTGAAVLPVYIAGSYDALTSRKPGRKKIFAPLTVLIGKVRPPISPEGRTARERRRRASGRIYDLLVGMRFQSLNRKTTVVGEFIRLVKEYGGKTAFRDATGASTSYRRALAGTFLLGEHFARLPDTRVGILLPNLTPAVLLFFGLQLAHKTPALLNYASGTAALLHMLALGDIGLVVTSREFLARIGMHKETFQGRRLVYLEDVRAAVRRRDTLKAFWKSLFPGRYYRPLPDEPQETAVILFTSGSEGMPKGVPLSHANIVTNIYQCLARIDVQERDYLLNALPLFHSFGLTVGTLLPLFAGAKVFLYVSPLHFRVVPETAYRENCTVLIGTNVFLRGYARKANPYDFYSVRYVYCGAEALQDEVFQTYAKEFGIRVMAGYGATECAPVVTMDNALQYRYGTVGKFLPGMAWRLSPVEGIASREGRTGRLFVRGKNVMRGYLKDGPESLRGTGWYDTGDIVKVDEEGFVTVIGRVKRFAKVSGEMVSMTAIEEALAGMFGERRETAVIAEPDPVRGERLILVADRPEVTLKEARDILAIKGFSTLVQPREIRYVPRLPRLATGKTDYRALAELLAHEQVHA